MNTYSLAVSLLLISTYATLFSPTGSVLEAQSLASGTPGGQTEPSLMPQTPTDAREILALGRQVNGLTGSDLQPWHLKSEYKAYDLDGNLNYEGTYEEWWVNDQQSKWSYNRPGFSRTTYKTDHGSYLTGNTEVTQGADFVVHFELIDPANGPEQRGTITATSRDLPFGTNKLRCVTATPQHSPQSSVQGTIFPTYCFGLGQPILRTAYSQGGTYQTVFNNHIRFQGHWIARDIDVLRSGKPSLKVHVSVLEPLGDFNVAELQPPSDAIKSIAPLNVGVNAGHLMKRVDATYPPGARALRLEGTVAVQTTIGKDGHIKEAHAISGPKLLQDAATNAVRQYVYTPYLLYGSPTEVSTVINVHFAL